MDSKKGKESASEVPENVKAFHDNMCEMIWDMLDVRDVHMTEDLKDVISRRMTEEQIAQRMMMICDDMAKDLPKKHQKDKNKPCEYPLVQTLRNGFRLGSETEKGPLIFLENDSGVITLKELLKQYNYTAYLGRLDGNNDGMITKIFSQYHNRSKNVFFSELNDNEEDLTKTIDILYSFLFETGLSGTMTKMLDLHNYYETKRFVALRELCFQDEFLYHCLYLIPSETTPETPENEWSQFFEWKSIGEDEIVEFYRESFVDKKVGHYEVTKVKWSE